MRTLTRVVTLLAALGLALALYGASSNRQPVAPTAEAATEANITRVTAGLLGSSQFAHHPLDENLAGQLLNRYMEVLDPDRSLFLQSDVAEFAAYRSTLARDTRRAGDTRPAHAIFARYLKRLGERVDYVTHALKTEKFTFNGHDVYLLDRRHAPRPLNLGAAHVLWNQRLRFDYLQEKLDGKKPKQIVKMLSRRATGLLRTMKEMGPDAVLDIYLDALAHVYDPHSDYFGHEQVQDFAISMNLSLFGIGARLRSEDGRCKIVELIPGGPAARSGQLGPGDVIVAVAQGKKAPVDVVNIPLRRTVQLIRGPKGTVVTLTVIPAGAGDEAVRKTVRLVRAEIKLEAQRARAKIIELPTGHGTTVRLGVIDLPSFYGAVSEGLRSGQSDSAPTSNATADVALLLKKLEAEHVRGVILDLRRNGGGLLKQAIDLTGLFISKGPVVQTRDPNGHVQVGSDSDPAVQYAGPLIVLTSRFSASASEIVTGALQDYGRALVVGDPSTFGKGTVQTVVPLAPIMDRNDLKYAFDPGAIKVTIRKFYRPSGASTQLKGVASDIVLPSPDVLKDVGESHLENPLPWDTVPPAHYERLGMVEPYLATLREESAHRVKTEEAFAYLRAQIARLKKRIATKEISLNESVRRQELAAFAKREEEHEKAVEALHAPVPVTYEITVQNAAKPGLPPPAKPKKSGAKPAKESEAPGEGARLAPANESPGRDVILNETEKILADYVGLLARDTSWMARLVPASGAPAAAGNH